jgi:hypothetical protein
VEVFDTSLLVVITYSCFTSAFYCAFKFPTNRVLLVFEDIVFVSFSLEIILKCVRLPPQPSLEDYSHLVIFKNYVKSGWFFMDIIATIPFYLFYQPDQDESNFGGLDTATVLKLLRMVRLPKILNLLDQERIEKFVDRLLTSLTRRKRVVFSMILKNIFRVLRLIVLTVIMTYFSGCLFYFISSMQKETKQTFLTWNNLDTDEVTDIYKFISVCYLTMSTLSTVGYGDLYPISNAEKVLTIIIMLLGVGFFSFVMSNFIDIIGTFNSDELTYTGEKFELHNWMTMLTRFRENKPLPNSLYQQINQHFKYYWSNNRLKYVAKHNNEFVSVLPSGIKRGLIVHYLFDDIFFNFRIFFNPQKYIGTKFLYDVAFGLTPRHFSDSEHEKIIYDEEEEVAEMYFIVSGSVGVGYHQYQQPLDQQRYTLPHTIGQNSFFGDYYLCNNLTSEFVHACISEVEAFALSKSFMFSKIFPKYPEIYKEIKEDAKIRYTTSVNQIIKHRNAHLEVINKRNLFNTITVKKKEVKI